MPPKHAQNGESAYLLACILGTLALAPFLTGVYWTYAASDAGVVPVLRWLLIYSATIVSFIGGIQWGRQLAAIRTFALDMVVAVCPALMAWAGLILGQPWSFLLIVAAVILAWLGDENGGIRGWQPWRFIWLRRALTAVVLVCLLAIGWHVLRA